MNYKQTAVEWLIEQIKSKDWENMYINKEEIFKIALNMEKKQSIQKFIEGANLFIKD